MSRAPSDRRTSLDALAVVTLLTCCTLWGLNQVAAKVALADIPPLTQAALRSAGAALLVLAWSRARGGTLAGALFALEFGCIFVGLQFTAASRMIVFLYLSPFVVALGMPLLAPGERLTRRQWAGLVVAFASVAVAFSEGFLRPAVGPLQWLGDTLGVVAGILWGATTLAIRASRLAVAAPEKTLAYQLVVSAVLLGLAVPLAGEAWPAKVSALSMGSMFFQTVIVTFASYLAWFWLVRHYPATRISAFTLLTPMAGLAFGVLLLGEPLTARLLIAMAGVALGLLLINRR